LEVSLLRLVTLAIFTTCYLSAAFATPNLNFATIAHAEEAPFQLEFSSTDFDYGKDIDLLFRELSKNVLKSKTIENFAKYQKKGHSFSIVDPIYDRLKLILSISNQDDFFKNCAIVSKDLNAYTDNIAERLNISVDKHCRFLFLKRLTALSANINLSSRDFAYFKEAAAFYSTGESQSDLVLFLRHFKSNLIEHEKLSNILIEKYIEYKIKPSSNVLAGLRVNPQFNKFLQNNLNLDDTSNSFFQDEFQRLSRDAQEAVVKGDYQLAKTVTRSAVSFYEHNKDFINTHKAWTSVLLIGKALFYKGKDADALEIFSLAKSISNQDDTSESFFYLLWPHLINKNYKAMRAVIDQNNLDKNFDKYDSKLQFWIATTFLKTGDPKKGLAFFNKIIDSSPYSFYSIISLKELAAQGKGATSEADMLAKLVSNDSPADYPIDKTSYHLKDSLRRLAVWNKIGNERFATLELRYIQFLKKDDTFRDPEFAKTVTPQAQKEFLIMNLIRLLNTQKKYITSFKVFQDSLDQNSLSLNYKLIKFIFPLNYIELIKKNAETLDPLIVISLIRQESAFNPEAKSGVGAKGLMQLMPATAKRFNKRVKVSHLGDPEINVAIGSKYLRLLISRFDGNLIFALASYNAGENRIDRWRREIFRNDDPLATIESIPYEETRNYVKLIYRNNFFYSLLSKKSILMTPLEETFKVGL
jgi:soluble lytic murein transglycosylase